MDYLCVRSPGGLPLHFSLDDGLVLANMDFRWILSLLLKDLNFPACLITTRGGGGEFHIRCVDFDQIFFIRHMEVSEKHIIMQFILI